MVDFVIHGLCRSRMESGIFLKWMLSCRRQRTAGDASVVDVPVPPTQGLDDDRLAITWVGHIDAVILPIGAYEPRWFMQPVHMSPEDAVSAYLQINRGSLSMEGCLFIPFHWGTFRLTDEPLDELPRFLRKAWRDAELPEPLLSLIRPGETIRRG